MFSRFDFVFSLICLEGPWKGKLIPQAKEKERQKASMIPSARPTVLPVAITILTWKLFCFARVWKVGMDGRTSTTCENSDHYLSWQWVDLVDQKREGRSTKFWSDHCETKISWQAGTSITLDRVWLAFIEFNLNKKCSCQWLSPMFLNSTRTRRSWMKEKSPKAK